MNYNTAYDTEITTSPYNLMNLPDGAKPNLSNPQINSNAQYQIENNNRNFNNDSNPRNTHRAPLGTETNFYDPTKQMVNNYLKNNISMYDNRGKYFDSYLFNQKFDQYIAEKTAERKLKEQVQLYDLDMVDNIQVQPYQLPLDKLLINFKNVWSQLFDELGKKKIFSNPINLTGLTNPTNLMDLFDLSSILKVENFFYYGITFIVIFILYIMLSYIFE